MLRALMASLLLVPMTGRPLYASDGPEHARGPGPVYVPLNSWVYPALRRLASMGYAPDADSLVAPWTRQQCSMLVDEAADIASRRSTKLSAGALEPIALGIIEELKAEFSGATERGPSARIESIYGYYTQIAGSPLRDSYHFGQTLTNDYGRPYGEGANAIGGISGYATAGRFSAYVRAEYQEAPATPSYGENVRQFIATTDGIPIPQSTGAPFTSRFDPVEMYVGVALGHFDLTAGKQSMWWGPGENSALHFSDNAEPIYAIRLSQSTPILLPGPLRFLGRIRTQFLVGRLAGHQFPAGPLINAEKITLQLTQNFELGFTRSAIFGGDGHPVTTGSFLRSIFSYLEFRWDCLRFGQRSRRPPGRVRLSMVRSEAPPASDNLLGLAGGRRSQSARQPTSSRMGSGHLHAQPATYSEARSAI